MRNHHTEISHFWEFASILRRRPQAIAGIKGSMEYPEIEGTVRFYQTGSGVLAACEVTGLPSQPQPCRAGIFGFHIHEGERCTGNATDPFADARMHYNPENCAHPYHAGDLPPLFENGGYAFQIVLSDRFTIGEILGKTVIIHSMPDDFTSQPAGNSGIRIACGEIVNMMR